MATTRVHLLAKELGVKSKSIVEKCQAEGLDVKNHMSTISAGLAATIKEWFSEGEHSTTVETAEKVDLKKVRIKKKKTTKKKTKKDSRPKTTKQKVAEEPEETTITAEPAEQPGPEIITTPPKAPEPVVPAGPMLKKPKPAKLSGPRVIRVEKPEVIKKPRPKPRPKPRHTKPAYRETAAEPLLATAPEIMGKKSASQQKGKRKTHGRRHEPGVTEESPRKQKMSRKLHSKDIEERRKKLEAADGVGMRRRPTRKLETKKEQTEQIEKEKAEKITITEPITVKNLSAALAVKTSDIIQKLFVQGVIANINQTIATDVAELVSLEFGTELIVEQKHLLEREISEEFENRERKNLEKRSPIVTMLGHVDHGKTSLLDKIRYSHITTGEAGGITQHIGAYQVVWDDKNKRKKVTFLDTPGHEAFTAMRARGANMTDIAVLVIAADDGIMPQTIEAMHHAKAANVAIIVALNKIDLPGVDINRIYGQLAEHELTPTEWGGNVEIIKTSATTGEGIEDLIEHLDYAAELLELKADSTISAEGWVVEARMSTKRGAVATVLIKEGKLKKGDIILAGQAYGRIRTIKNSSGKSISSATSAMPVEISGLSTVPQAGDKFYILKDINRAKTAAEENKAQSRQAALSKRSLITLENLFSHIEAGKIKEVNVILRADVQGSVDVLTKYLTDLNTDEVQVKILHAAVGGITEGDVVLAEASGAIVIGFNVVPDDKAAQIAEEKGVDIRLYNIIYRITEDLKKAMSGLLEPEEKLNSLGKAIVRNTFKISGLGTIAGCFVEQGQVNRNAKIRLIRNSVIIKDNCAVESLRHFKEDVRQVKTGLECGIKIVNFDDVKIGDVFEVYEIIKVERIL